MIGDVPTRKKVLFHINKDLHTYLVKYEREAALPIQYEDLLRFTMSSALLDSEGRDTLWESIYYSETDTQEIHEALTRIYALLKTDGDIEVIDHLTVSRIDYCTFGNTHPFRVRIINRLNDNYDHFYVKKADASRVYGLELEDMLSPNTITYLTHRQTLVEEHIVGMPGDDFIRTSLNTTEFNQIRIAKEFVKFNERCFVRLLGDMRSYNYVVAITPDIEGNQYRIRAIDFDQQSYEGKKSFYLPQYFKENNPIIFLGIEHMSDETVKQYQLEERSLIANRVKATSSRLNELLGEMRRDKISQPKKVERLKKELAQHHRNNAFSNCKNMGEIVLANIKLVIQKEFTQSIL